jgi:ATP-dependent RNA helicase DeaD
MVPLILKGRDIAATETLPGTGATTGILAPLVLSLRGAGPAPRALILASGAEAVGKAARAYARLSRTVRDAPVFAALGEVEDAKREQRRLEKGATIVVGTADRVIDHIRRGSLAFEALSTLVIQEPGEETRADFVKDVQFIVAKFTARPQVILFLRSALTEDNELAALLHHSVILESGERVPAAAPVTSDHLALAAGGSPRPMMLARVVLGMKLPPVVALYAPRTDARSMAESLRGAGITAAVLPPGSASPAGRASADRREAILSFTRNKIDVLLVPLAATDLGGVFPSHVVLVDLPGGGGLRAGGILRDARLIALVDRGQEKDLARLEEARGVTFQKGDIPGDDAVLSGAIDRVIRRMKEEDPSVLAHLRARIRRQVPFFQRGLFSAALLRAQLPGAAAPGAPPQRPAAAPQPAPSATGPIPPRGQRGRFGRSPAAGSARAARPSEGHKAPRPEARKEGEFAQLFVSIGRNRRVFARELTELFTQKLQLGPGDIGGVRVFDKYSFVDIVPGRAEQAISLLNGTEVKGRPIAVNYAKKKEEKDQG